MAKQNQLYEYYREELRYLRDQGGEFGRAHPKFAELLSMEQGADSDPFVRRLVESFAFLTARIQMKLDQDFPQISTAILDKTLPLTSQPFPAFSVAQFCPTDQLKPLGERLPREETIVELVDDSCVQFRTCYDMTCKSLEITECEFRRQFPTSQAPISRSATSAMKMSITGMEGLDLVSTVGDKICIHIADSDIQFELAEFIFNPKSLLGIEFSTGTTSECSWVVPVSDLKVLGFEPNECVLPICDGLPFQYQIVMEMLAYPAKHLFFELPVPSKLQTSELLTFDLFFYFDSSNSRLEQNVDEKTFALNCSPIVNLSRSQTISQKASTYFSDTLINPNLGDWDYEIFDLGTVLGFDENGMSYEICPFHSTEHLGRDGDQEMYFHCQRKYTDLEDGTQIANLYLSIVDLTLDIAENNKLSKLEINPLCCNRRFQSRQSSPAFDTAELRIPNNGLIESVRLVSDWRIMLRNYDENFHWGLISLLNLNFLLLKSDRQVETLRRMLELLDRQQHKSSMSSTWIDSIVAVSTSRTTDRIEDKAWSAVVEGTTIKVSLSELRNQIPGSWFVFAMGLNRFFSLHAAVNSFTQLSVFSAEDNQLLVKFPKRCGTKSLI